MTQPPIAAIILAAGKGTRMKSSTHKVLHPIAGRPMLMHLMSALDVLAPAHKVVVVGSGREQLEAALAGHNMTFAVQDPQLGTGHAVQQAETALNGFTGDVLILYGDVPLVRTQTMAAMIARLNAPDAPAVVVLGFTPPDALAYGRVIAKDGVITKMVEFKDATPDERACKLCNSGLMAVRSADLFALLARVTDANAAKEFYLVDIVNIASDDGRKCAVIMAKSWEVAGVNSRTELAEVERDWQHRRRTAAMDDGATLIAPETVWFSYDTILGRDVTVGANVVFGPGTLVKDNVMIHSFSHLHGAIVESGAEIGPYARLRPGAVIGVDAKIGNFVEVKKAVFGKGAKANHLSYIGDAVIGAGANIGAGTITCNYDGFFKYQTVIGDGAFIGSNSALVAPVTIGDGAIVGAGSVVTTNVSPNALALVRPPQTEKKVWATRFRELMAAQKAENKS